MNKITVINDEYFGTDRSKNYLKDDYSRVLRGTVVRSILVELFVELSKERRNKRELPGGGTAYGDFDPYMTVETSKYKLLESVIHRELDKLTDFRTRDNREFFEIDPVDAADLLKNLARLLDDAEIVEYGNVSSVEEKSETTIKQQGNRTSFHMLGVPVGSKLTATNKGIPDVVTVDEINQVRLPDGSVKSISRAVIDAVGGHHNGFRVYKYNGKQLSSIRKSFDENYLPNSKR